MKSSVSWLKTSLNVFASCSWKKEAFLRSQSFRGSSRFLSNLSLATLDIDSYKGFIQGQDFEKLAESLCNDTKGVKISFKQGREIQDLVAPNINRLRAQDLSNVLGYMCNVGYSWVDKRQRMFITAIANRYFDLLPMRNCNECLLRGILVFSHIKIPLIESHEKWLSALQSSLNQAIASDFNDDEPSVKMIVDVLNAFAEMKISNRYITPSFWNLVFRRFTKYALDSQSVSIDTISGFFRALSALRYDWSRINDEEKRAIQIIAGRSSIFVNTLNADEFFFSLHQIKFPILSTSSVHDNVVSILAKISREEASSELDKVIAVSLYSVSQNLPSKFTLKRTRYDYLLGIIFDCLNKVSLTSLPAMHLGFLLTGLGQLGFVWSDLAQELQSNISKTVLTCLQSSSTSPEDFLMIVRGLYFLQYRDSSVKIMEHEDLKPWKDSLMKRIVGLSSSMSATDLGDLIYYASKLDLHFKEDAAKHLLNVLEELFVQSQLSSSWESTTMKLLGVCKGMAGLKLDYHHFSNKLIDRFCFVANSKLHKFNTQSFIVFLEALIASNIYLGAIKDNLNFSTLCIKTVENYSQFIHMVNRPFGSPIEFTTASLLFFKFAGRFDVLDESVQSSFFKAIYQYLWLMRREDGLSLLYGLNAVGVPIADLSQEVRVCLLDIIFRRFHINYRVIFPLLHGLADVGLQWNDIPLRFQLRLLNHIDQRCEAYYHGKHVNETIDLDGIRLQKNIRIYGDYDARLEEDTALILELRKHSRVYDIQQSTNGDPANAEDIMQRLQDEEFDSSQAERREDEKQSFENEVDDVGGDMNASHGHMKDRLLMLIDDCRRMEFPEEAMNYWFALISEEVEE